MIAILKYGCGMPFHRLEKLQESLGMPVPASSQWEIIEEAEQSSSPFTKPSCVAAQGDIVHNDDTTARILACSSNKTEEHPQGDLHHRNCLGKR